MPAAELTFQTIAALSILGSLMSPALGKRPRTHLAPTPRYLLEVTRLTGPTNMVFEFGDSGAVERWDASYLRVYRCREAILKPPEARRLLELAAAVPAERNMGDRMREGDIYRLVDRRTGKMSLYLEPLAPQGLHELVQRLTEFSDSIPARENTKHYVRAEPLDEQRVARFRAADTKAFALQEFDADTRQLLGEAIKRSFGFLSMGSKPFHALTRKTGNRTFYVDPGQSTWYEVGLWSPP